MCRWMLGEEGLPQRVFSIGGRFGYDDDATTPNTQIAVYDYPTAPLIFEVRGLPAKADVKHMDHYQRRAHRHRHRVREAATSRAVGGGGVVYDTDGKKVKSITSSGGDAHMENFIKAVRSRKAQDLAAPVAQAHISSALCHLGNISYRLGTGTRRQRRSRRRWPRGPTWPRRWDDSKATSPRTAWTWPRPNPPWVRCSPWPPDKERFESSSDYDMGAFANRMLRDNYRPPYVMPEQV